MWYIVSKIVKLNKPEIYKLTEALVSNFEPLLDCPQAAQLVPTQLELFVV